MTRDEWVWDESLYAGSAEFYARGRLAYPAEIGAVLSAELELDGGERLLDVGCGPGSLTLVVAPFFAEVVAIDADGVMIEVAISEAARSDGDNINWVHMRAEELPGGLGTFDVVTFAQSFHWMERSLVARTVFGMIKPGGFVVHVGATTHRGVDNPGDLPLPTPPHAQITELIELFLGPVRRAGRGTLAGGTASDEDDVFVAANLVGPRHVAVGGGQVVERSEDQVVAAVFSLSSAAPRLFGDDLQRFEADLRTMLQTASPSGRFLEKTREVDLAIWRRPDDASR